MSQPHTKQAIWGQEYLQRRADGHPGWGSDDMYERKQARVQAAIERYGVGRGVGFLELGCGAGNVTLWASAQGLQATGIDFVPEAVAWAKEQAGAEASATFIQGDVTDMRCFADRSFDVVFDSDCLHMIFDPGRASCLAEVQRVLRPGGLFLLGGNVARPGLAGRVEMRFGHYDADEQIIYIGDRPEYQLRTQEQLIAAGLEPVRVERRAPRGGQPFVDACMEVDAIRPVAVDAASA